MMNDVTIRLAEQSDAVSIAGLMDQLGYPGAPREIRDRIARFSALPSEHLLVAEHQADVVGVVNMHLIPMLHASGNAAKVTALVVSEKYRARGIGTRLMREAEDWAWSQGCVKCEVVSADRRADAHRFYESLGYQSDEMRFLKQKP